MASRIDTLDAPAGARRIPFVGIFVVLVVVVTMLIVGLTGWGWLIALLVPLLALTAYIVVNTVRVLIAVKEEGEEDDG